MRILLSVLLLIWVLHAAPLDTIVAGLRQASPGLLVIGMLLGVAARFAAAERTQCISRALGLSVTRAQTLEALFISNFYALLSPGPVLSGVVTVYRYRSYGASMTGSVTSLLASRVIEAATFIALGTLCVLLDPAVMLVSVRVPLLIAAGTLALLGVCALGWYVLHRRRDHQEAPQQLESDAATGVLARLRAVHAEVMRRGPAMALQAALPASAQVILSGAAVAMLSQSLGFDLALVTAIWVSAAVYAAVLLPISVAGLGVREVTLLKSLALLSVPPNLSVALSVLMFADPVLNALIGGVVQFVSAARRRATSA
jgi:glycosyltransferase 2 family protein